MKIDKMMWDTLGIQATSDTEEIRKAYRSKLKTVDATNYEKRKVIRDAYETIVNNIESVSDEYINSFDDISVDIYDVDNSSDYYKDFEVFKNSLTYNLELVDLEELLFNLDEKYSSNKYFLLDLKNVINDKIDVINYDCLGYIKLYISREFEYENHLEVEEFLRWIDIKLKTKSQNINTNTNTNTNTSYNKNEDMFQNQNKTQSPKNQNKVFKNLGILFFVGVIFILNLYLEQEASVSKYDRYFEINNENTSEPVFQEDDEMILDAISKYSVELGDDLNLYLTNENGNQYLINSKLDRIYGRYTIVYKDDQQYLLNVIDETLEGPFESVTGFYEPNTELAHYYMIAKGDTAAIYDDELNKMSDDIYDADMANYYETYNKSIIYSEGEFTIIDANPTDATSRIRD